MFILLEVLGIGLFLVAILRIDDLMGELFRHQHDHYHEQWVQSGCPVTTLWKPEDYDLQKIPFGKRLIPPVIPWMFLRPDWIKNDSAIQPKYSRIRMWFLLCYLGGTLGLGCFIIG